MSQSILKHSQGTNGDSIPKRGPGSVRLDDGAHVAGEAPNEPLETRSLGDTMRGSHGGTSMASTMQEGAGRRAPDGRSAEFSGTMSGLVLNFGGRDLKSEAKKLVAFSDAVQQQLGLFGDGHPQGGKIAVSYAQACTVLAKECLTQDMLRTSRELLGLSMHYLRCNHSMLVFGEQQRALAETHNNMGCLENKRGNLEAALKHLLAAVKIEADQEWEVGHAATILNVGSTMSLLGRHDEALTFAKQAVDMLLSVHKEWDQLAADPTSEAGELLPIAFNNLGLEFEFTGQRQQASQAYEYAVMLATRRWGLSDPRTAAIMDAASEADQNVALGQFRVRKKLKPPPMSSTQLRRIPVRTKPKERVNDERAQALLVSKGTRGAPRLKKEDLDVVYSETNDPIHRPADSRAGFHSPRFWAVKDGMAPRRASSFNKDLRQVGLEMARRGGASQFPNTIQKTRWGEFRVQWEDLPDADLSRIDGSVMSRTRVFSDVCNLSGLEATLRLQKQRHALAGKFPDDRAVYTKALGLRDSLRQSMHSLPELR
jgi:tetratricopeptide (TPR) repeat protein